MSISRCLYKSTIVFVFCALASCSGIGDTTPTVETVPSGAFKVAILLPYSTDDSGWGQGGYEGLLLIEKELGAQIAYTTHVSSDDAEQLFRQYATRGFDFIIGHGGQYIAAAKVVAEEFPRTKFAVVTRYAGNNRNLGALSFRDAEVLYLAGVVAALKTKTNRLGFIGGEPYTHLLEQATAFEYGAQAANPAISVSVDWIESWSNPDKARQIARSQIESGVDVLVVALNDDQLAVFEEAEQAGIYTIAGAQDKHALSPDTILTSTVQQVPVLLLQGAILVRQGHWEGKQYKFGIQEGAQDLAPFYGALTPEEEETIRSVKQDIITGKRETLP